MNRFILLAAFSLLLAACSNSETEKNTPWEKHGNLMVAENSGIIQHEDGTPFLWLGCTAWGMTEWLTREDVDLYLDDRKSKGMNVVQFCLVWGKRTDYPIKFVGNAPNSYGQKAFIEVDGFPDANQPQLKAGGSPDNPNDYWDHVDYCLNAIKKRGMYAAVLPFWGRRYVNGTHGKHSMKIFTNENIFQYGEFLGKRYRNEPHIIWVNGGDVNATDGGDFKPNYRLLVEGLVKGVSAQSPKWNEKSDAWDTVFLTYHPDGTPMLNSSEWFHNDAWLDFNMIETHIRRDYIAASIRQDLQKLPLKPTIMAEAHYEGMTNGKTPALAIHIRRQAYQTFFAGAAGHTYGGGFDEEGNGPLFSLSNNWKHLLNWEGAGQMIYLRKFLEEHEWYQWKPVLNIIEKGQGEKELEKLVVEFKNNILIYFPENTPCTIKIEKIENVSFYNTKTGKKVPGKVNGKGEYKIPDSWEDGVVLLEKYFR